MFKHAITNLQTANNIEDFEVSSKAISHLFGTVSEAEQILLTEAINQKAKDLLEASRALNKKTDELLAEFYAQKTVVIEVDNQRYSTKEWATIEDYCKEFKLNSTTVVTNWIKRNKIPAENIITFPSLGGLKLIRKINYA